MFSTVKPDFYFNKQRVDLYIIDSCMVRDLLFLLPLSRLYTQSQYKIVHTQGSPSGETTTGKERKGKDDIYSHLSIYVQWCYSVYIY